MFCHLPRLVLHFNHSFFALLEEGSLLVSECCHGFDGMYFYMVFLCCTRRILFFVYWGWKPLDTDFDLGGNLTFTKIYLAKG